MMRLLRTPLLIINLKNYLEASGKATIDLAVTAESVARDTGVEIALAPSSPFLSEIAKIVELPILAQHLDVAGPGSTTGSLVPEIVQNAGIGGSLVNHSEHRIPRNEIREIVQRLGKLDMTSILCAQDQTEVSELSKLLPTMVAIEPPDLIGSGVAVSKAKPELVSDCITAARGSDSGATVICGAGIITGEDVKAALQLGARGVLVASGIVKNKDWRKIIEEMVSPMRFFEDL